MNTKTVFSAVVVVVLTILAQPAQADRTLAELSRLAVGDHRSPQHQARNMYRNPAATLAFFGLEKGMTVVEISPGGAGWYTEILAPYLRDNGVLYAAGYDVNSGGYFERNTKAFAQKLAGRPDLYDQVKVTVFEPPEKTAGAPPESADMVVTFRNLHNYLSRDAGKSAFDAMYTMLKPGGILGVVQHRADTSDKEPNPELGYVSERRVVQLAEQSGFVLLQTAEINANPKDTKNHPEGVWTLPPSFELGDKDKQKYQEMGESDRMTLKFVKPVK